MQILLAFILRACFIRSETVTLGKKCYSSMRGESPSLRGVCTSCEVYTGTSNLSKGRRRLNNGSRPHVFYDASRVMKSISEGHVDALGGSDIEHFIKCSAASSYCLGGILSETETAMHHLIEVAVAQLQCGQRQQQCGVLDSQLELASCFKKGAKFELSEQSHV